MFETLRRLIAPRAATPVAADGRGTQKAGRAVAVDLETTGLSRDDRIVTFAAVELIDFQPTGAFLHLIFNPGRKSHFMARAIHGWPDDALALQEPFSKWAVSLRDYLSGFDEVVAHNAAFDRRFLNQEFQVAGLPSVAQACCTMEMAKVRWPGQKAGLDACVSRLGLPKRGKCHGALEDAWLAAHLYCHFHGVDDWAVPAEFSPPSNLCPTPEVEPTDDDIARALARDLDGVGVGLARALVAAGLRAAEDVLGTPDAVLLTIKGFGRGKIAKMRGEEAGEKRRNP